MTIFDEIADAVFDIQDEPTIARYRSAVDGVPDGQVDLFVEVVFWEGFGSKNILGTAIEDDQAMAMGRRSALSDASTGGLITIRGKDYVVVSRPQDDGAVWTKLLLGDL